MPHGLMMSLEDSKQDEMLSPRVLKTPELAAKNLGGIPSEISNWTVCCRKNADENSWYPWTDGDCPHVVMLVCQKVNLGGLHVELPIEPASFLKPGQAFYYSVFSEFTWWFGWWFGTCFIFVHLLGIIIPFG